MSTDAPNEPDLYVFLYDKTVQRAKLVLRVPAATARAIVARCLLRRRRRPSVSKGVKKLSCVAISDVVRLNPFCPPRSKLACVKRPKPPRTTVLDRKSVV